MIEDVRRLVPLFGLVALFGGCSTVGTGIPIWPAWNPDASSSGVVFKFEMDAGVRDVSIDSVRFYFPRLDQIESKNPTDTVKTAVLPGAALGQLAGGVVLIPLPPGNYYGMTIAVTFDRGPGTESQRVVTAPDGLFQHFRIESDKLIVLGAVRDVLRDQVVLHGINEESSVTGRCVVFDDEARRLQAADAALARPEAARLHWSEQLESARADVISAGDFADAHALKSWPSRASAPVAAEHQATAALFRVKIAYNGAGYSLRGAKIYFRRAEETGDDAAGTSSQQYVSLPGSRLAEFPNNLVLAPLVPGRYAGALLVVDYGETPVSIRLRGDFDHFDVQSGKVVVLEDADIKLDVKSVALPDGKSGTEWHADVGRFGLDILDPDPRRAQTPEAKSGALEGRRAAVDAALARPEADTRGWRAALEAAKAGLSQ